MEKKEYVSQSIKLGIMLFIATQLISYVCLGIHMALAPTGTYWTPILGLLTIFSNFIFFICWPFSKLFVILTKNIYFPDFIYKNSFIIKMPIDLAGWIVVAFLVQFIKLRKIK